MMNPATGRASSLREQTTLHIDRLGACNILLPVIPPR